MTLSISLIIERGVFWILLEKGLRGADAILIPSFHILRDGGGDESITIDRYEPGTLEPKPDQGHIFLLPPPLSLSSRIFQP